MRFRLWTILWAFALLASALATFGAWGILFSIVVLGFRSAKQDTQRNLLAVSLVIAVCCGCVLILLSMTLPKVQGNPESPRVLSCKHNLHRLAMAVHTHALLRKTFPPTSSSLTAEKPPVSWRVRVLPYADNRVLFDQFVLKYSKDDPNYASVSAILLDLFSCREDFSATIQNRTSYFAVVGDDTIWPETGGRLLTDVTDQLNQTLSLVEIGGRNVTWAEPRDLNFAEAVELMTKPIPSSPQDGHYTEDGFFYKCRFVRNVAFADGSVRSITMPLPSKLAHALLTCNGNEPVDTSELDRLSQPQLDYGRIYSLLLFVALSLVPAWTPSHNLSSSFTES